MRIPIRNKLVKEDNYEEFFEMGRATGAHLDVRLNWFQTRLDPETVLNIK